MLKYRNHHGLRVAYGFSGRIQDEMEAYQGFREVADEQGWQVWVLHEQFEIQLRGLLEKGVVDAVVGDFISLRWIKSLPTDLTRVHRGTIPLGEEVCSVTLDMGKGIDQVKRHFDEMGYEEMYVYSPKRLEGLPWIRSTVSLREVLESKKHAGIFCGSDYWARKGIQLARSMGKPVPEQFGFVGIGDSRLDRLLAEMDISTLPEPHRELGQQAALLVKAQLEGASPRQIRVAPRQLIPRQSSRKTLHQFSLCDRLTEWLLPFMADPPPVEEWARRMGMSRRSFENAFVHETGVTPYVYFMKMRTQEAQRLLSETEWTIARIGQTIGIPDPPRFSAFFKKTTGQTPSAWRRGVF